MIIEISGYCQYEDCEQPATVIACGRRAWKNDDPDKDEGHPIPGCYCLTHGRLVSDERAPEYTDECPNCGCMFGIN